MQSVSSTFTSLFNNAAHRAEVKVIINSVTYTESSIYSLTVNGDLFGDSALSFGGCVSRTFELAFNPGANSIPKMAAVYLYMRLTNGITTSEWIQKGKFFIDTRDFDPDTGVMTLKGYDSMLKAEQIFNENSADYPRAMSAVAADIASAIGVTLDSRNRFNNYSVHFGTGYTMREILGYIAGVHCGNWIITDTNTLRLVRSSDTVSTIDIGKSFKEFTSGTLLEDITHVIINIDDDTIAEAAASPDNGITLEVTCPWGTTAMAQEMLSELSTLSYMPYEASTVLLNPAAEIGDNIALSGATTYIIATVTNRFDSMFSCDLSAPGDEEIDHEYTYESTKQREIKREIKKVAVAEAELRVTMAGITARVTDAEGNISTLEQTATSLQSQITSVNGSVASLSLTVGGLSTRVSNAEGDISTVEQTVEGLTTRVTDAEGNISTLTVTASKIDWIVKSGTSSSNFTLTDRAIALVSDTLTLTASNSGTASILTLKSGSTTLSSANIVITGFVTFLDLSTSGSTTINGGNITTGVIQSSNFNVWNKTGMQISLSTGTITTGSGNFSVSATGAVTATSGSIAGWTISSNAISSASSYGAYNSSITLYSASSTSNFWLEMWDFQSGKGCSIKRNGVLSASGAIISGTITATSGTFQNSCVIGSSSYNFTIAQGGDNTTCLYTQESYFSGMGGFGVSTASNVSVYIGGDGLSYWGRSSTTYDYNTAIRPGGVFCSGDKNGQQEQNRACLHSSGGIVFYWGGYTNLRTCNYSTLASKQIAAMSIRSTDVLMQGTFTGNSSGSIVSDRNLKNTIANIADDYSNMFDALMPRTFKYNDGTSGRVHIGFIAQEVKAAMDSAGITTQQFAAYISAIDDDGNPVLSLRYEEFVALNTLEIQKLKNRIAQLEAQINA